MLCMEICMANPLIGETETLNTNKENGLMGYFAWFSKLRTVTVEVIADYQAGQIVMSKLAMFNLGHFQDIFLWKKKQSETSALFEMHTIFPHKLLS